MRLREMRFNERKVGTENDKRMARPDQVTVDFAMSDPGKARLILSDQVKLSD